MRFHITRRCSLFWNKLPFKGKMSPSDFQFEQAWNLWWITSSAICFLKRSLFLMGKAAELHFAGKYCTTYSQDSRISIVITHKFIHSIFQKLLFQIMRKVTELKWMGNNRLHPQKLCGTKYNLVTESSVYIVYTH